MIALTIANVALFGTLAATLNRGNALTVILRVACLLAALANVWALR